MTVEANLYGNGNAGETWPELGATVGAGVGVVTVLCRATAAAASVGARLVVEIFAAGQCSGRRCSGRTELEAGREKG